MRVCSASLQSVVASGLIFAFTIFPVSSATAQESADNDGLPLSPVEKAQNDGTALPVSLTDFTKMVLQSNLDIAISDTNEAMSRQTLVGRHGAYDPTLRATFNTGSRRRISTSIFDTAEGGDTTVNDSLSWGLTYSQAMKTGGRLDSSFNSSRSESNSNSFGLNPNYSSTLQIQYTQPIWRNLRIDSNRNQIKLANLDIESNDISFKQNVTRIIANVQTQYWNLVSAIRNYDIQRNSVRLAMINLRDQQRRLEVGTIPPIDVTTAEASVASRELSVIQAEERILQMQNNLRALVSSDRNSDIWKKVIVPTDAPDFSEYKIDADTAVAAAIRNRPEMELSRINVTELDLNNRLLREGRKWGVDLNGSFELDGTSGTPSGNMSDINPDLIGGFPTAYSTMFSQPNTNWSVGLTVNIPLKNRQTESQIAQNEISKRQELMRQRQTEQTIQVDVLNALQSLESSRRQIAAAEIARKAAAEQYDGEVKRNEAGLTQNYRVLEVQQQLSNQEYSELQALIGYKQAVITLQQAMYNLLEDGDFSIAKGSSSNIPDFK